MRTFSVDKNNSQPTFGFNFSRGTVRLLKKISPHLVEDNGFKVAKEAIENLADLHKRNDGITLRITSDDVSPFKSKMSTSDYSAAFRSKNSKSRYFAYGGECSNGSRREKGENCAGELLRYSKYISSEEVLNQAKKVVEEREEYLKNTPFMKRVYTDLKYFWAGHLGDKKDDFFDLLPQLIFPQSYFSFERGKNVWTYLPVDAIKYLFREKIMPKHETIVDVQKAKERVEIKELRKFIDKSFARDKR